MKKDIKSGFFFSTLTGLVLLTAGIITNNQAINIIGTALATSNAILVNKSDNHQSSTTNLDTDNKSLDLPLNPPKNHSTIPTSVIATAQTPSISTCKTEKPIIKNHKDSISQPTAQSKSISQNNQYYTATKPQLQPKPNPSKNNKSSLPQLKPRPAYPVKVN